MSTTVLYHMHGIRGYRYQAARVVNGELEYHIKQPKEKCVCPCCKSKSIILKGKKKRRFLSVPSGSKKVTIVLQVPRIYCTECHLLIWHDKLSLNLNPIKSLAYREKAKFRERFYYRFIRGNQGKVQFLPPGL